MVVWTSFDNESSAQSIRTFEGSNQIRPLGVLSRDAGLELSMVLDDEAVDICRPSKYDLTWRNYLVGPARDRSNQSMNN